MIIIIEKEIESRSCSGEEEGGGGGGGLVLVDKSQTLL